MKDTRGGEDAPGPATTTAGGGSSPGLSYDEASGLREVGTPASRKVAF